MGTEEDRAPSMEQVKDAAASIVSAFAATDTDRYFAGFAPEASFVFHTEQERLEGRAAYESLWAEWLSAGWRVVSCQSSNQHVTVFPGGAVFVHDVATTVALPDGEDSYRERETIVFRHDEDGRLVAVHEHLSPMITAAS
ncbi:nuclear transport factor 2 family protein [Arthrobacter sp.]|uniref:YybH family protein n=1 Tax=Arthrobacter sp. TaxID=1667 RepID=UPI003395C658